jgi:hypothetical protein
LATEPEPTPSIKKYYGETTADEQNDGNESEIHEGPDDTDESANDDYDDSNEINHNSARILQFDGNDSISSVSSSTSHQQIPVNITHRTPVHSANIKYGPQNKNTVKRSNKTSVSLCLPNICNINPQSVYNKQEEFITFVEEMVSDVIFMSESWERETLTLENIMKPLENHTVVSNVHQRGGKGGRPALIINCRKYHVQNITQSIISIPWGVEAVWAIITPKDVQSNSIYLSVYIS